MQYIALDIGGSSVKYALLDESMNISARGSISCGRTGMACISLCPVQAIDYGNKTQKRNRYSINQQ